MGLVGVSLSETHASMTSNPAALYFRGLEKDSSFYASVSFGDAVVPAAMQAGEPVALMQQSEFGFDLSFSGRNLGLTIQLDNRLSNRTIDGTSATYDAYYHSLIQLDFAFGFRNLGIGAFLRGGNRSVRENITISEQNPFFGYLTQTLLERYVPVENSDFFNIGLGIQLNNDWVSMGLCTESLVSSSGADTAVLSGTGVFDTLTCGVSFKTPTYTRDNQLSMLVFQCAGDFYHLGDDDTRELRLGAELTVQLYPDWSVYLRTGYVEQKASLEKMFSFSAADALQTFGLGAGLENFSVDLFCQIPVSWYLGETSDADSVLWSLALSFSM
jgi:hypothetical protein